MASWRAGEGTVDGAAARSGIAIALGQAVASSATMPARIELVAPAAGALT
ncbi:MAG: hypothetical protein H0W83_06775, partial [Planctomycetes bacterium]|nr:hypothetical protein [Planctomycetota bacterium]